MKLIRVFPRKTSHTPDDDLVFIGDPPLFRPDADEVHVSCAFTWDRQEAERLAKAWADYYPRVYVGGPAFSNPGDEFEPGVYLKNGITITSRGCPNRCSFCFVPKREGALRLLKIKSGHVIQDNNILACPREHVESVFEMLESQRRIVFSGGLDSRKLKQWHVDWFTKHASQIKEFWFASDGPQVYEHLYQTAELMQGFSHKKKRCYVLVGYNDEDIWHAEKRLIEIYGLGFLPFAQFYRGPGEIHKTKRWAKLHRTWSRPAAIEAYMSSGGIG